MEVKGFQHVTAYQPWVGVEEEEVVALDLRVFWHQRHDCSHPLREAALEDESGREPEMSVCHSVSSLVAEEAKNE